jgi:hypothetical protein
MNILAFLVLLSGIAISACGAYFSIIGLKMLFVGGGISIIIMGTALEIGKLITATFLKQKWDEINMTIKIYMILATLFLMGITSIGIYGYLSAGYTATSIAVQGYEQQIEANNKKVVEIEKEIEVLKNADYNSEEIKSIEENRKKFIEQKLQLIEQKNKQIEKIRSSASNTTQDGSVDITAAKQALELSKSSMDSEINKELEQIKLYNARLEILDKEIQKWMDSGSGGLFKKSGLENARIVKENQAKERSDIDEKIKTIQDRIEKIRKDYNDQVKAYNDRVATVEERIKSQKNTTEENIKRLEKENEESSASIDVYNKQSDEKIASLNSKKGELAEADKKKVVENLSTIQSLQKNNVELKEKIVHTDVGTFKFIANSFNIPLDKAVNYFIWSIMLVFDPLAIALILAYNTLIGKPKKKEEIIETPKNLEISKNLIVDDSNEVSTPKLENSGSLENKTEETREIIKYIEVPKEVIKYIEVPKEIVKYVEVPKEVIKYEQIPEAIRSNFLFMSETKSIQEENVTSFETGSIEVSSSLVSTGSTEISSSSLITGSLINVSEENYSMGRVIKPATPNQPPPPPAVLKKHEQFSRPPRSANYYVRD